jgi:hypothetical protein
MPRFKLDNFIFDSDSKLENKKYDVYKDDKYMVSFGDKRYGQYKDRIGYYGDLDHNDKNRRRLFRLRHEKNIKKMYSPAWFAAKYLW